MKKIQYFLKIIRPEQILVKTRKKIFNIFYYGKIDENLPKKFWSVFLKKFLACFSKN